MKRAVFAITLLTACSPAPQSKTETPGAPTPAPNAAALSAAPAEGQWFFNGDEGVISANFGPPESEGILSIVCNEGDRRISLHFNGELTPDQEAVEEHPRRIQVADRAQAGECSDPEDDGDRQLLLPQKRPDPTPDADERDLGSGRGR